MSTNKANPAEFAIINMTIAEKRLSILPILLAEQSFADVVAECHDVVHASITSLTCHAGYLPDPDRPLLTEFRAAEEALHPRVREHVDQIAEIYEDVLAWRDSKELPGAEAAAEMVDWATRLTRLTQRVVRDLDE